MLVVHEVKCFSCFLGCESTAASVAHVNTRAFVLPLRISSVAIREEPSPTSCSVTVPRLVDLTTPTTLALNDSSLSGFVVKKTETIDQPIHPRA